MSPYQRMQVREISFGQVEDVLVFPMPTIAQTMSRAGEWLPTKTQLMSNWCSNVEGVGHNSNPRGCANGFTAVTTAF